MDTVCSACQGFLTQYLTTANCLSIRQFAEQHNCVTLLSSVDDFAMEHFPVGIEINCIVDISIFVTQLYVWRACDMEEDSTVLLNLVRSYGWGRASKSLNTVGICRTREGYLIIEMFLKDLISVRMRAGSFATFYMPILLQLRFGLIAVASIENFNEKFLGVFDCLWISPKFCCFQLLRCFRWFFIVSLNGKHLPLASYSPSPFSPLSLTRWFYSVGALNRSCLLMGICFMWFGKQWRVFGFISFSAELRPRKIFFLRNLGNCPSFWWYRLGIWWICCAAPIWK